MKITKLIIKNFQLFKDLELSLDNINLITGINLDDLGASGNASGKTTIINAILFALYGDVSGLTLKELVRTNTKNTEVKLDFIVDKQEYQIARKIPTSLKVFRNEKEQEFSTNTLTQKYIDRILKADIHKFKMYHVIDQKKGINLLDLGTLSLRKQLMEFVDTYFSKIRTNLLSKKLDRETYNIDKRLYTFYLSDKKLLTLKNGLQSLKINYNNFLKDYKNQNKIINNLKSKIQTKEKEISLNNLQIKQTNKQIDELTLQINNYQNKIDLLNKIESFNPTDYNTLIIGIQKNIDELTIQIEKLNQENLKQQELNSQNKTKIAVLIQESGNYENQITKLENEIESIQKLDSNTKCDKCGSDIKKEKKDLFITEKQKQIEKLLDILKDIRGHKTEKIRNQDKLINDILLKQKEELQSLNNQLKKERINLKSLNEKNTLQLKQKEKFSLKKAEINKYNELIDLDTKQTIKLKTQKKELFDKIEQLSYKIEQFKSQLKNELDYFKNLENQEMIMVTKIRQTESHIMKLKEAFKFKDYKYTKTDVQLYVDSIKVLDQFASFYVQEWLSNLSLILNDLLQNINLSIEFSTEKNFIKVKDNEQEFNYAQLSSGQKAFLNCIFKIGILLNEGINEGLLLIDEGLGKLDKINLEKLLDILKGLNYQCFIIYQNINKDIKNINYIEIIRENGESKLKEK